MNMKDAFRFQNKLQTLMGTAQDILSSSRNITNEVMPFYCHSRFPGEDVDSFRHLNHENPDAEIALIEWQPIKPVKLKENAHE